MRTTVSNRGTLTKSFSIIYKKGIANRSTVEVEFLINGFPCS
jgi:hypothetical protein